MNLALKSAYGGIANALKMPRRPHLKTRETESPEAGKKRGGPKTASK